jgi:uncharacterized membrane protein YhhN
VVIVLTAAIMLCAALAVFGSVRGWRRLQYLAKPLATALILLLALTKPGTTPAYYRVLVVIGLAFSILGDILLLLPQKHFVLGLASFLVAHLFYSGAFMPGTTLGLPWLLPLLFTLLGVTAMLWPKLDGLRAPVLLYALVIVFMVWRALARLDNLDNPSPELAAMGALLFMVSDSLLGFERFRGRFALAPLWVLGTYYLAQWFIALSV